MKTLSTTLIVLAGLVNLAPVIGVLSASRLQSLYGLAFEDADLLILMRHRAILLGIVGCLLVTSAFRPPLRPAAFAAGLVSMLSFVLIAWFVGNHNAELARVATIDLAASAALVGAVVLDQIAGKRVAAA
jgi:hypothetical protein